MATQDPARFMVVREVAVNEVNECLENSGRINWKVQFYRSDSPELYTINGITYKLRHKAIEVGGEYDGWETSVEKGKN